MERVELTAFQGQEYDVNAFEPASVELNAKVAGELSGTVYAVISDSAQAFASQPIEVVRSGAGNYYATLKPNVDLKPGVYSGQLGLRLCKDPSCVKEYSVAGGTIDYRVTLLPRLEATVLVNGVRAGDVKSGRTDMSLEIANGSTVEIRSSVPVRIQYSSGPGLVTVQQDRSSTKTVWKAVIALDTFPTTRDIQLVAVADDATRGTQMGAGVNIGVRVP